MDAEDTCDVVVLGFEPGPESPVDRLQRAFGIDRATAEALLSNLPATVQRQVSPVRADYFRRGLIAIGARVELRTSSGVIESIRVGQPPPEPATAPTMLAGSPRGTLQSQPPPPMPARPISVRPSSSTLINRASQSPALAATEPPPPAIPPAAAPPVFAWSPPEPQPSPIPIRGIDPMSATLAQLGAIRPSDLHSAPRPNPSVPAPAPSPPVIAGSVNATLREAVPAPVLSPPVPAAPIARPAHPTALAGGPAPAPVVASARAAMTPAGPPPAQASGWQAPPAAEPPPLHLSRDPSSVLDPPPAHAPHPPRPQAVTLPKAEPEDFAPIVPTAAAAAPAYGGLAVAPLPMQAAGPLPLSSGASYESVGTGPLANAPAPLMLDLSPVAIDPRALREAMHAHAPLAFDPTAEVIPPWEEPDPSGGPRTVSSRAPRVPARGQAQSQNPRPRAQDQNRNPRARLLPDSMRSSRDAVSPSKAPKPAVGMADRAEPRTRQAVRVDPRSFWETFGEALALPFTGTGPYWIGAIAAWSVVVSLVGWLCNLVFLAGITVMFAAQTSLIAFACDYYRVCLWPPIVGEKAIDVSPTLDPQRLLDRYIRSGIHLTLFAIASQIPVIAWLTMSALDGRALLETLTHPVTWGLFAFPYVYWPMAVALTALGNDFSHVWNLLAGFRAIARAPVEYAVITVVGLGTLVLTGMVMMWASTLMGATGAVLSGTVGVPLAISHGIQGALMGHLARARADVFE